LVRLVLLYSVENFKEGEDMKEMRSLLVALFVATVLFGMVPCASAYTIVPADADWTGNSPNNPNASDISTITGHTVVEYYREDNALVETGTLSGSYNTAFHDDPTTTSTPDWDGGTITYVPGTPYVDGTYQYLLVRDGSRATPVWYIFDISTWNGTDPLVFGAGTSASGWFWEGQYGISHVAIFGNGTIAKTPEPATLILYGLGFAGAGLYARIRRRK
jgi:hypothetical protein